MRWMPRLSFVWLLAVLTFDWPLMVLTFKAELWRP
jgi:hypothetical protein